MTESEWLSCSDVESMLDFLRVSGSASQRKLRLFAVASCQRVRESLNDIERKAASFLEKFVEGLAGESQRAIAYESLRREVKSICPEDSNPVALDLIDRDARFAAEAVLLFLSEFPVAEVKFWCHILRDLFGPLPFRSLTALAPSLLHWNGATIPKFAQVIYDECRFTALPYLADALKEAGCDNAEILTHCRSYGEHTRGCWVVDLILGKS
jgi:hypothetical protein